MTSTTDRTQLVLEPELQLGEVLHAATQAQLDGGTMRLASRVGAGAAGGVGVALMAGGDPGDLELLLANGLVLAVTDRRVLLLDVTAVSARPKSVVASVERSRITEVATGEKRVMLVKLPTIALTIDGDDGGQTLRFEVPKNAKRDAETVVDALRT